MAELCLPCLGAAASAALAAAAGLGHLILPRRAADVIVPACAGTAAGAALGTALGLLLIPILGH